MPIPSIQGRNHNHNFLSWHSTGTILVLFPFPAIPTSSSTTSVDGVEMSGLALILQHGTRLAEARSSKATQTGSQQRNYENRNSEINIPSTRDKNVTTLKVWREDKSVNCDKCDLWQPWQVKCVRSGLLASSSSRALSSTPSASSPTWSPSGRKTTKSI